MAPLPARAAAHRRRATDRPDSGPRSRTALDGGHRSSQQKANACAISLAIGQAIGRIGCLLVGDDYGRATDLPWGIAFPQGLPPVYYAVHPTQIYESAWLFLVTLYLWQRRKKSPSLMGEYLILNGIGRTVVEHWRLNARVALDLSEAQWIGVGLVLFGAILLVRARGASAVHTEVDSSRS